MLKPGVVSCSTANSNAAADFQNPVTAFTGGIEPTKVSFAYRVGLAMVALGMVLLSVVYFGIILLTAYGVYYHWQHDSALVKVTGANWVTVGLYLTPVFAGVVMVFFMIKPYFAAKPEEPPKYSLTPQSDPVLFALIWRICELVRAPRPSRVDVDCQINASAGFRRGLLSLRGNDVVLTIGLPLAAGLTVQEFAGVLAHEFGHFAQGAGMRLTYIIRQTNGWFARVVYERDEWDLKLAQTARQIDIRIGIFLHLTRFCVWLTRRILWVLMHAGHAISCFMLRQMEYDADSYEIKLAGSAAFAQTVAKIENLMAASPWVDRQLRKSWKNRRLPGNLPAFINFSSRNIPSDPRPKSDPVASRKKTRIFDTHPCDASRVQAAEALNQPGVFHVTEPAATLFNDFDGLSRAATRFHYEHNLKLRITEHNLVAQEVLVRESQCQAEAEQSRRRYFLDLKWDFRPILVPAATLPLASAATLVENLKRSRQAMEESKPAVAKALAEYEQAEALYQRGLNALLQNSQQATGRAAAIRQKLIPTLETFETHVRTRLGCALQLLQDPELSGKVSDGASLREEAARLAPVFARLGQAFVPLQELRRQSGAFTAALQGLNQPALATPANRRVGELTPRLKETIKEIRTLIEGVPYPFPHPREGLTLDEFARNDIPATHKLEVLYNDCSCHLNRLLPLYRQVLERLTFFALKVEEQI
jgi:Zn-dependent protease with chaperone function